jgi:NADPH:quinone reductase-like Zn-dependent oxidoreductase
MRAVRVHETGGPEVLRVEEVPDPIPAPDELLIDVEAVGVNFIEIYQRQGQYPRPLPFTMGAEAAGTVRAVGSAVVLYHRTRKEPMPSGPSCRPLAPCASRRGSPQSKPRRHGFRV